MSKIRLDHLLHRSRLARSRSHAQQLIKDGFVQLEGRVLNDPAEKFETVAAEKFLIDPSAHYVSRGALKLLGALKKTGFSPRGLHCIDIGISTGGFSQVLLEAGAREVIGIDVGRDQLSPKLQSFSNLKLVEGVNARNLNPKDFDVKFELAVIDVSFISLSHILPNIHGLLAPQGKCLALVKPQFELGKEALNKKGVVEDATLYPGLEKKIRSEAEKNGLAVIDYFESEVKGGDGNTEFFCYAARKE
jgi:23S rRNA (cytidine1920-2'-O)/16S rRNA (cytidine1409-2'-O)-methyltransferase